MGAHGRFSDARVIPVIPAKAGYPRHPSARRAGGKSWMPAFAGLTDVVLRVIDNDLRRGLRRPARRTAPPPCGQQRMTAPRGQRQQRGGRHVAGALDPHAAAAEEGAALQPGQQRCGRRRVGACGGRQPVQPAYPQLGHRGAQQLRVGMHRPLLRPGAPAAFHRAAGVHHHHLVGDRAHRVQVVADEHHGHPQRPPQLRQQIQHRGADNRVQRRSHLVADQHGRFGGQRPGQVHPAASARRTARWGGA